ncbi:MAG TPA: FtsX-like permease family protein [Polyangiaceae bacterium]|nr:FtsX-like permease family protein [Polyangiaceae bacterium]
MSVLWRKLLRDLWHMKGQCVAVAVLIALGVGTFVGAASTHRSLEYSRDTYYAKYGLAHVFAEVARAPNTLGASIAAIPGVESVQMRLATSSLVTLPGFDDPVTARVVALPDSGQPTLGRIHLRKGRLPENGSVREAVVSEALANAQHLEPGGKLSALIDGRRFELVISGIGLSPEHVYEVKPGDLFPDNARFGILWLQTSILEEALGMRGSFNEVALRLSRGADEAFVVAHLDRILKPYGGMGGYGRRHHVSARFIAEELRQLQGTAFFVPSIFLGVAVFLLNIIVGRVIATQREQIATLKALGYGNPTIALHYLQLTTVVVALGALLGWAIGYGFGRGMTQMYAGYYRFAEFHYYVSTREMVIAVGIALVAGVVATLGSVRRAVSLQPAEAMQPAAPAIFHRTLLERLGVDRLLTANGRMILRNLSRRPWRALASCVGIAFAVAILIAGMFSADAMDVIVDNQFRRSQRHDLQVVFNRALSKAAVIELGRLQGVLHVEPQRVIAANLRYGHRSYRNAITGLVPNGQLQRVLSTTGALVEIPEHGIMLSETLANNLGASIGSTIQVELLEGERDTREATVTAIADEPFGTSAYASVETANALAGTGPQVTSALLKIDRREQAHIFQQLQAMPTVMSVSSRRAMLATFERMTGDVLLFFAGALTLFAGAMAVGVVYNAARISLSERERELATMRVVGMTRNEVFFVLFGELTVLVLCALPLGCGLGYVIAKATAEASSTDMYRIPVIVLPVTYLYAMAVVLVSTLLAALVVRRRISQLDLVSVLKTKE